MMRFSGRDYNDDGMMNAKISFIVHRPKFIIRLFDPLAAAADSRKRNGSAAAADRVEPVLRPYQQSLTHQRGRRLRHIVQFIHMQ